jgi:hypothetical protein
MFVYAKVFPTVNLVRHIDGLEFAWHSSGRTRPLIIGRDVHLSQVTSCMQVSNHVKSLI